MAQNYTRQSSMADGDTITAALFNNEYNQLVNAFAYSSSSASSTGHRHDGSAGQGGNIPQIGDLDFLNKVVVDGTNNRVGFFVEVSSSAVEQIRVQDGAIVPVTDNDIDLGTSSVEFKDLFLDGTAHIDTLDVDVNATVAGTLGVTGATTLSSTLAVTGAVTGSSTIQGTTITATTAFVPDASDGAALGTSALEFSDLFLADGAVINLGADQDTTLTHVADTGILLNSTRQLQFGDSGTYIHQSANGVLDLVSDTEIEINATTIDMNGALDLSGNATVGGTLGVTGAITGSSTVQGTTITATTAFVPDASDGAALGTSSLEFSDLFLADGAVISFGDDQDVTLTHVADTGLLLSSTDQLQFGDSGTYIHQSANGVLDLVSDTEIEINATTIDINGAVDISGNLDVGGNLVVTGTTTFNGGTLTLGDAASDNVVFGADVNSSIIPNTDNTYDLGSSLQEWKDIYIDGVAYLDAINFNGTAISATAAELNILDGVTATTAELNILDGVTSTAAELNILDGVTATAAELNILDGVTATTAELNIMDGVTSTTAELNILDGVTSTAAELNILDGKAFLDEDNMASNSATGIASQQSIKAYVDSQVTAQDLDVTDGTTSIDIDLDSESLGILGGTGIDSTASGTGVTLAIDSTVATLTGSQTLTNKTIDVDSNTVSNIEVDNLKSGVLDTDLTSVAATDTTLASAKAIKTYVDAQVTAQDLDFQADSGGALNIDLDSETLTFTGGTGIDTSGSGNAVTFAIDSTVATLTGSQTLTNKSLTAPTLTGTAVVASLDISGDIDVDGTTNLDVIDVDGAANFAADVTFADGADIITASAGTSNFRAGVNAGNSIASGGNYNVVVGDEAGTALTTGDNNTAVGYQAGDAITTGELNTVIGAGAGGGLTEANRNVAVGKDAMRANTLGSRNVAIGESALDAMNLTSATDSYNIGVGYFAGGSITVGESNTLIGGLAGDALTDADFNVAVGKNALSSDTLGSFSVAVGINALEAQNFTSGTQTYNTAVGGLAGGANTTGKDNTFLGGKAGKSNTTGQYNVYVGADAGEALTVGSSNVAVGRGALEQDTKGSKTVAIGQGTLNAQNYTSATDSHNAAVGHNAAVAVTTGVQNSVLGSLAGDSITTGNGNTILGYNADVNSGSAASRIVIGNQVVGEGDNRITVGVGGNIATLELDGSDTSWAASSDERLKENITDSTAGLSFINDLRPVTYNWKKAKDVPSDLPQYVEGSEEPCLGITYGTELHGFIAQEVKTALDNHPEVKAGQGVWNENPSTVQTLAPSALIPMLVKAIQELTARVAELEGE